MATSMAHGRKHHFQCGGFISHHRFPICKLVSRLADDWQDDWSLPVILARSQIDALQTRGDPEGRLAAKYRLIRRLFELKMHRDEILSLYTLIDWMMRLRPDLEVELNQLVCFHLPLALTNSITPLEQHLRPSIARPARCDRSCRSS